MPTSAPKLIVITGVTRGLGRALAERFVSMGHHVLGCGRSAGEVEDLARKFGTPHDIQAVDVSDDRAVKRWAERLLAISRAPDLLINNAALMNRKAVLWEIGTEEFDAVVDVNLKGVANVIRHFCPAMVARRGGVIANLSSGWGRATAAEVAPYCATKWAIEGLTKALAQELPRGMAAVPVNPGIIDTEMLRDIFGAMAASYPSATRWAELAAPFFLRLGPAENGKSVTVPTH